MNGSELNDANPQPVDGMDGKAWAGYTGFSDLHPAGESYAMDADSSIGGAPDSAAPSTPYRQTIGRISGRAPSAPLAADGSNLTDSNGRVIV